MKRTIAAMRACAAMLDSEGAAFAADTNPLTCDTSALLAVHCTFTADCLRDASDHGNMFPRTLEYLQTCHHELCQEVRDGVVTMKLGIYERAIRAMGYRP